MPPHVCMTFLHAYKLKPLKLVEREWVGWCGFRKHRRDLVDYMCSSSDGKSFQTSEEEESKAHVLE